METGVEWGGDVSLVRRVRGALEEMSLCGKLASWGRSAVRRDIFALVERLESMRLAFPDDPDLLDRAGLGPEVIRLLEEACGRPLAATVR